MSEELKAAQARIACLEGEIAKRDARIGELEEQRDRFTASIERKHKLMDEDAAEIDQLRAELVALKDAATTVLDGLNERIAYAVEQLQTTPVFEGIAALHSAIYAAPVPEAKAQGVVMPERMSLGAATRLGQRFEVRESFCAGANHMHDEFARLNAAPVQQVSVPDGFDRYRLANKFCEQRLICDDSPLRSTAVDAFSSGYGFGLAAAPAAPAADAGLVEALGYQALFDAIAAATSVYANGSINISVQAFRDALASHRAKGVV